MKLSQSNIGVTLSEESAGPELVSLKVTFPDFLTGRFEVAVHKESDAVGGAAGIVAGNVTFISDIWKGSSYDYKIISGSAGNSFSQIVHVDVRPATAGIDNELVLPFSSVSTSAFAFYVRPYM